VDEEKATVLSFSTRVELEPFDDSDSEDAYEEGMVGPV